VARPKRSTYDLSQRKLCVTLIEKFGGMEGLAEKASQLFEETSAPTIKAKLLDMAFSAVMSLKEEEPPAVTREDLEAELQQYVAKFGKDGLQQFLAHDATDSTS